MNETGYLVKEGPQIKLEGDVSPYNIRVPTKDGSMPTITGPAMYVYKNGSDATSTFTTGSLSVSGDVITTKDFQALVGGDMLHVTVFATVNGKYRAVAEFPLTIRRLSGQ